MKFVRRHLVLALTVIMLMSVMVLAVSARGNTTDVTETRYVYGSSQAQSTYRDKKDNTAVYLKIKSCEDDHLYVRVWGCTTNGSRVENLTMAGPLVDDVVCRTGLNYSVHNKVYESNYRVVRLTFQRLNPAAGGISTTYVWSADSSGSYNGAA